MEKINTNDKQSVVVVNNKMKLLGVITDGDIRRGMLKGFSIEDEVDCVMNTNPLTFKYENFIDVSIEELVEDGILLYPIIGEHNNLVDIYSPSGVTSYEDNRIIIMAGGLGTRLRPITEKIPKALVLVRGKPILSHIIDSLKEQGLYKITLSVNYKAEMIEKYFGDGSRHGVKIDYIYENKRMGTAGSLSLIGDLPNKSFIVMNCDLITNINYRALLDFHKDQESFATMCVKQYDFNVPYGVIETVNARITKVSEKPVYNFNVNAGIYAFEPEVIELIPDNTFYDMPILFQNLSELNRDIYAFPVFEDWVDIGMLSDLKKANK
jgi:dTDP-glucose pyrophosphorylase